VNDFHKDFPDDNACLEWLVNHFHPNGIYCKKCGRITKHHRLTNRRCYSCDNCGTHFYPTAGTIFHKSSTPLKLWFYAVYLMSSTRCGVSAKQLQRQLGVTYKAAWRMFHQIRKLLKEDVGQFSGEVEMDETYVGGKRPGKRGRGAGGKTVVAGISQRKGKVIAEVVPNVKAKTLIPMLGERVLPGSIIYTDELLSYTGVGKAGYHHRRIHHAQKIYVKGDVHTNTIECFWSQLKRSLDGTHHAVSAKYLQRYLDEFMFRYNHRRDEQNLFVTWLSQVCQGVDQIGHPLYGGTLS
jgi:transposase-like protein